jgi:hypothetical protein
MPKKVRRVSTKACVSKPLMPCLCDVIVGAIMKYSGCFEKTHKCTNPAQAVHTLALFDPLDTR